MRKLVDKMYCGCIDSIRTGTGTGSGTGTDVEAGGYDVLIRVD